MKIAFPEYNTMKKTLVVTVCCVNTGKVINTRRKSAGSSIETNLGVIEDMFRSTPDTGRHLCTQADSRLVVLCFRSFRFTMMGRHNLFLYGNVFFVFRCFKRSLNKENCIIKGGKGGEGGGGDEGR